MPAALADAVLSSLTSRTTILHRLLYLSPLLNDYSLEYLQQSSFPNHTLHLVSFQSIIFKAQHLLDKQ